MTSQEKATQLRVGIFMALGLAAVAAMVVYFGRFGDGVRSYYKLRVEFANASGLFKGASVLLAGAKIGTVDSNPVILPDMDGVYIMVKIYEDVKIPSKSEFSIGSSGLLGDRFIEIVLLPDAKQSPPIEPGTMIKGRDQSGGLSDVMAKAGPMLDEAKVAVAQIKEIVTKLNSEVFSGTGVQNLNATLQNLKESSASFAEASKKIDGIVTKAEGAIDTGKETMTSAKEAADELRKTIADVHVIVNQTKAGRGALGALLVDREMAENLKALVANLKRNGILWYKDRPVPADSDR